ncbi:Dephospho-CoA kinase domain-containing protein [Porphyridium purpureum]|uniref:Dephospho-CoA kinase domain-containing protein n=1 Tax=Porphyridium purpureum TaxID=35688 RepID=A0A5J4ZB67_PORPP|nr:Dephospho-CoA kinase domain-containing protein [Porphyridium purpureum]|eukprot:POR2313..scf295_1
MAPPVIVGLTGGIASGKSTAAAYMRDAGVPVIDADLIARQAMQPPSVCLLCVRLVFGKEVINEHDGTLNRARLGQIIFGDPKKRALLNRITHPFIVASMMAQLLWQLLVRLQPVVVLDVPLLFETKNVLWICSKTVVVACEPDVQLARLQMRNPELSENDAKQRMAAQMPMQEKTKLADIVVDNSGTQSDLRQQISALLQNLYPSRRAQQLYRGIILSLAALVGYTFVRFATRR